MKYTCTCPEPQEEDISPVEGIPMIITTWTQPDLDCERHGKPAYVRYFGYLPPGWL